MVLAQCPKKSPNKSKTFHIFLKSPSSSSLPDMQKGIKGTSCFPAPDANQESLDTKGSCVLCPLSSTSCLWRGFSSKGRQSIMRWFMEGLSSLLSSLPATPTVLGVCIWVCKGRGWFHSWLYFVTVIWERGRTRAEMEAMENNKHQKTPAPGLWQLLWSTKCRVRGWISCP